MGPAAADLEEKANPYMNWETVNPEWWCRAAMPASASMRAVPAVRPGKSEPSSFQEGVDTYDAIEWIASALVLGERGHARHLVSRDHRNGALRI